MGRWAGQRRRAGAAHIIGRILPLAGVRGCAVCPAHLHSWHLLAPASVLRSWQQAHCVDEHGHPLETDM